MAVGCRKAGIGKFIESEVKLSPVGVGFDGDRELTKDIKSEAADLPNRVKRVYGRLKGVCYVLLSVALAHPAGNG